MSNNKDQFRSLTKRNGEKIYSGDNYALEVKGNRNVWVNNKILKNMKFDLESTCKNSQGIHLMSCVLILQ